MITPRRKLVTGDSTPGQTALSHLKPLNMPILVHKGVSALLSLVLRVFRQSNSQVSSDSISGNCFVESESGSC